MQNFSPLASRLRKEFEVMDTHPANPLLIAQTIIIFLTHQAHFACLLVQIRFNLQNIFAVWDYDSESSSNLRDSRFKSEMV